MKSHGNVHTHGNHGRLDSETSKFENFLAPSAEDEGVACGERKKGAQNVGIPGSKRNEWNRTANESFVIRRALTNLEPDHVPPLPQALSAPLVNFLLRLFRTAGIFVGDSHFPSDEIDDFSADESIDDDERGGIGGDGAVGGEGEKVGGAGSGADEGDFAAVGECLGGFVREGGVVVLEICGDGRSWWKGRETVVHERRRNDCVGSLVLRWKG